MRTSILNRENKSTFKEEYQKMMKVLNGKCITFNNKEYSYFDYINIHLFNNWKHRGTYIDCYEYLESIGIHVKTKKINKESFLNLLEFICNIQLLINSLKYYAENTKYSIQCKSILTHNIPILINSYGLEAYSLEDRIILLERDLSYDDLSSILPNDVISLLLTYKDVKNNGIKMKRLILYKIYQYMIKDIDKYKSFNPSIFNSIKTIVTKMGVMKEIDKKYSSLSNYKLRKYYDNCFEMMVYLIKTENILKIKEEIKNM